MSRRLFLVLSGICLVAILVGIAPVVAAIGASLVADAAGCTLHEGFTNPCIIAGSDRGELLYTLFVSGWFGLVSLPVAVIALLAWLLLLVIYLLTARRRRTE